MRRSKQNRLYWLIWMMTTKSGNIPHLTHVESISRLRAQATKGYAFLDCAEETVRKSGATPGLWPYMNSIKDWINDLVGKPADNEFIWEDEDFLSQKCVFATKSSPFSPLVISPDWLYVANQMWKKTPWKFLVFRRKLHEKGYVPWFFPGDLCDPVHQLNMKMLGADRYGLQIMLPNTTQEASHFGISSTIGPLLFLFPQSELRSWGEPIPWDDRGTDFLVPGPSSGDSKRQNLMDAVQVASGRYPACRTRVNPGNLDFNSYRELVKNSKIVVTTNHMQSWYQSRISSGRTPKRVATLRTWQALAAGSLLWSQSCSVLHELGFVPSKHYLELPEDPIEISANMRAIVEGRIDTRRIAEQGRTLFHSLCNAEKMNGN